MPGRAAFVVVRRCEILAVLRSVQVNLKQRVPDTEVPETCDFQLTERLDAVSFSVDVVHRNGGQYQVNRGRFPLKKWATRLFGRGVVVVGLKLGTIQTQPFSSPPARPKFVSHPIFGADGVTRQ